MAATQDRDRASESRALELQTAQPKAVAELLDLPVPALPFCGLTTHVLPACAA